MNHTEELLRNLKDTIAFLKDISIVEEEKFQAALKNHILVIEDCIKKEQALLLRSKGLEQKREQLQKAMGAEHMTLKQIIEATPSEEKAPLQTAFDELSAAIKTYQEIHRRAKTAIEVNLHRINKELESMTGSPLGGSSVGYTDNGEKLQKPKSFTNRKI